jgi:glycosyltransferase involved in cell wall biosynthesis
MTLRCPSMRDLPPPPPGKTGWPWTIETPRLSDLMPSGRPWPRISIVTPSYNQGEFIEETIRSILLQGYPNLEYVVVDGGSCDSSIEVIEKYRPWLTACVIEPDTGQPNAINKGFKLATGEIWQWINSDDLLLPGALETIALAHEKKPGHLLAGNVVYFGRFAIELADHVRKNSSISAAGLIMGYTASEFHQPGIWFDAQKFKELGGLNEHYQYAFDWHFLVLYLERWPKVFYLDKDIVKFRYHLNSKTVAGRSQFEPERLIVVENLLREPISGRMIALCKARISVEAWWRYLDKLKTDVASGEAGRLSTTIEIIAAALMRPRLRVNRLTAGFVRLILFRKIDQFDGLEGERQEGEV